MTVQFTNPALTSACVGGQLALPVAGLEPLFMRCCVSVLPPAEFDPREP